MNVTTPRTIRNAEEMGGQAYVWGDARESNPYPPLRKAAGDESCDALTSAWFRGWDRAALGSTKPPADN
jgi:hypothetical protein